MRYFILLAIAFLFFGCASNVSKAHDEGEVSYSTVNEGGIGDVLGGGLQSGAGSSRGSLKMLAAKPEAAMARDIDMGAAGHDRFSKKPAIENSSQRMVNYTGNIYLQSSEPESVIDTVIQKAKEEGGYITVRRNGFILLQIPVAEFKTFFNYILTLGTVVSKSISANDITDAFTDNAERLRIAENTLARLKELLANARAEQEKIALLKEIQRVNEQIEQAKLTEKELLRMAAFSTIRLNVRNNAPVPRPLNANIEAFDWFRDLPSSRSIGDALKLKVPQNFIETKNSSFLWIIFSWNAASVLNTELAAFEKENEPQGTVDFWANAMLDYFKHKYKSELKTEDNFSLIRLQGFQAESAIYYIAILKKSDKKTLKIVRAIFPNEEAEKKDSEAVLEVLRRAK